MDKIDVPLAWVPLPTVKGGAGRPPPCRLVGRATPPLTCTDGSCRFLCFSSRCGCCWWCPADGRPAPPPLVPAPGGRTRGTGQRPGVVQRFALRCVAEDSCPSTAGASLCRAAAERCTKTFAGSPGARPVL